MKLTRIIFVILILFNIALAAVNIQNGHSVSVMINGIAIGFVSGLWLAMEMETKREKNK